MNSENSKTFDLQRILLNLTEKITYFTQEFYIFKNF